MDHHIYEIDRETGEAIWKSEDLGGAIVGTPVLQNNSLYVGSFGQEMLAIDAGTGKVTWRYPTAGWVWSGPVLDGEALYFGDLAGGMYALKASTGEEIWKIAPPVDQKAAIPGQPLVKDGSVYFTSENGVLYTVDAASGNSRKQELGGKLYTGPQSAGNLKLIPSVGTDALLIALDENNNQVWAFQPEKK
jgi:outer membrane protein assembly factor BamB